MAKLADILQQERERDTADKWGIIHLYKTGSFYSAYEWSAWLIAVITFNDEVRMQTKDRQPKQGKTKRTLMSLIQEAQQQQSPAQGGLIMQIMSYQLSQHTPAENFEFIQRLQQQIASIL